MSENISQGMGSAMSEQTAAIAARLETARKAAELAAERTLKYFRGGDLGVESKSDGSEVTKADREAEQVIREEIARVFPDDTVVGEEYAEDPGHTPYRWVIDPIDGTFGFVRGVPLYSTLIAIEHDGVPEAGVIALPALDEAVWAAKGLGCYAGGVAASDSGRRCQVSQVTKMSDATVAITSRDYFAAAGVPQAYADICDACRYSRGWADAYPVLLVAEGRVDLVVETGVQYWDLACWKPIVEEAGGRVTDWRGASDWASGSAAASNGLIHADVLDVLSRYAVV